MSKMELAEMDTDYEEIVRKHEENEMQNEFSSEQTYRMDECLKQAMEEHKLARINRIHAELKNEMAQTDMFSNIVTTQGILKHDAAKSEVELLIQQIDDLTKTEENMHINFTNNMLEILQQHGECYQENDLNNEKTKLEMTENKIQECKFETQKIRDDNAVARKLLEKSEAGTIGIWKTVNAEMVALLPPPEEYDKINHATLCEERKQAKLAKNIALFNDKLRRN